MEATTDGQLGIWGVLTLALAALAAGAGCARQAGPIPTAPTGPGVTAVRGDLASVNLGSADGLRRGRRLRIHRDGEFVAHLVIEEVGESSSAGLVVDAERPPVRGDAVEPVRAASGPAQSAGASIRGEITGVSDDVVGVNVGSGGGMKVGQVLLVYRGSNFVCNVRIAEVGAGSSAGVAYDKYREPAVGDRVVSLETK